MSELNSELRRMADDAARQARPPAAAEIMRQGDHRRRRSLTRQSLGGLSAAGVVGAGVALGLGVTGAAPAHSAGTVTTTAFTLVDNADGTATLTINPNVLLDPSTLQSDLAKDGIPAMVTLGSFCSSDPAPNGIWQVISVARLPRHEQPPPSLAPWGKASWGNKQRRLPKQRPELPSASQAPWGNKQKRLPNRTMTINPAAMPTGTELSFGNFQSANSKETIYALVDKGSYTCASAIPANQPPDSGEISYTNPAS
jgi:hypothetical protein